MFYFIFEKQQVGLALEIIVWTVSYSVYKRVELEFE